MVVVVCQGGLGNQMFQYALSRAIARQRPDVVLDTDFYASTEARDFGLAEAFMVSFREYHRPSPISALRRAAKSLIPRSTRSWPTRLLCKAASVCCNRLAGLYDASFATIRDLEPVDIGPLLGHRRLRFDGYWQSKRYFEEVEADLRHDFQAKNPLPPSAEYLLKEIEATESVSVHIRRGDYAFDAKAAKIYGGICTPRYYERAAAKIMEQISNPRFFVFSDDIDRVREEEFFAPKASCTFVNSKGSPSWVDMILMSKCRHNIIANSSYSWWATWLNVNPSKIVLAPSRWINEGEAWRVSDLSELQEKHWELVQG